MPLSLGELEDGLHPLNLAPSQTSRRCPFLADDDDSELESEAVCPQLPFLFDELSEEFATHVVKLLPKNDSASVPLEPILADGLTFRFRSLHHEHSE